MKTMRSTAAKAIRNAAAQLVIAATAAVWCALVVSACGSSANGDGDGADSSDAARAQAHALDSALTSPPPALAQALPEFAADTVPITAPDGGQARYGLKSARIVQRYTGNSRGDRTLTFDNYGMLERREERVQPFPAGKKGAFHNTTVIVTPEQQVFADNRSRKAWTRPTEGLQRYVDMGAGKTRSLAQVLAEESDAQRLPDTVISGYHCRVLRKETKGMIVTKWMWRGIVIGQHVVSPKDTLEYSFVPIEITPNVAVPDSTFKVPTGFTVTPYRPGVDGR